ncbi:extracellular solute-binding protein [Elioraea rosea]|uniref:extracellular solute-binding protein n=1 Tax=Elioraea rosea TaxID=2492390 RepID=UPI0011821655|nr:extracellular solute-binding protein [Elioraea rosea]
MIGSRINRRALLAGAAAALAAPHVARAQSGGRVIVGTWGGDYQDLLKLNIADPLMAPKGIETLYDVGVAPPRKTKLLAERTSRRGSMDVACLSDIDMFEMSQLNLFEEPTEANVPNMKHVIKALAKPYALPHIYSGKVILYNPDKMTPAPRSYNDLWDPKWRGRIGFADGLYMQVIESAAMINGGSPTNFEPAKAKLMELKKLEPRVYPSNEALAAALKSEEVYATIMWLARGYMWKKGGLNLTHAVPEEGATPIIFDKAVPRNAPNKANGWAWMNAMLDPKAQLGFADRMGYVPTVTNAEIPAEIAREISFTPEQQEKFIQPNYEYIAQNNSQLLEWWTREFKG